MKVIFLDIDGVLNTSKDGEDKYGELYNLNFIENLRELINQTDAKVVCTSSWRHMIKKIFEGRNYGIEIYDITPDFSLYEETIDMDYIRGEEIKSWLELNPTEKYIIIDDRTDFLLFKQKRYTVKTSGNYYDDESVDGFGFTKECLRKAFRLFR